MSAHDIYLHDICVSLRLLVDAALAQPEPAPAAQVTELREPTPAPKRKAVTRDELQADARAQAGGG
jgi:hypothetical protein